MFAAQTSFLISLPRPLSWPLLSYSLHRYGCSSLITGSCLQLPPQMGDYFMFIFISLCEPNSHPRKYPERWGPILEAITSVHIPTGRLPPAPDDFWEELFSCPGLPEGSVRYRRAGVTGVNSPTRGRFTARDRNHPSEVCSLSPNQAPLKNCA